MKGCISAERSYCHSKKRWNLSPGYSWVLVKYSSWPKELDNDCQYPLSSLLDKMTTLLFLLLFQQKWLKWTFWVASPGISLSKPTSKDSVLPLIPFAFWLLLLCWLWSSTTSTAHLTSAKLSKLTVAEKPPTSKGVEVKLEDFESEFSI